MLLRSLVLLPQAPSLQRSMRSGNNLAFRNLGRALLVRYYLARSGKMPRRLLRALSGTGRKRLVVALLRSLSPTGLFIDSPVFFRNTRRPH